MIENISFYLSLVLVFLLPTQLGKHFWFPFSFVQGLPVDYLSITIYLTDILLLFINLFNLITWRNFLRTPKNRLPFIVAAVLVGINLLFSVNRPVTIFYWFRLLLLFGWWLSLKKLNKNQWYQLLVSFGLSVLYVSLLAIWQFIHQSSINGLWYWLGERKLDVSNYNTAAFKINGQLVFRPYSTFSHPNSLAGFLVLSLLLLTLVSDHRLMRSKLLYWICFLFGLVTLFMTLSRTAIFFGTPLVILALGTKYIKLTSLKSFQSVIWHLTVLFAFILFFLPSGWGQTVDRREVLQNQSWALFVNHPVWGVGAGSFISATTQLSYQNQLGSWLQPVHNIFWLIVSEMGLLGFSGFLYLFTQIKRQLTFKPLVLTLALWLICLTGSWDHYWLTLPQNRLLLVFYLGMVFAKPI